MSTGKKYKEYKGLNLPSIADEVLKFWKDNNTFEKSISTREGKTPWVFYEGPPSANGMPGIHHVMGRTIKDIFCRYKTLQGFQVKRKAGWDTHGLPIELGVEKSLGITKEDIGNKNSPKYISVEDYNKACRKEVMKFTDKWEDVTNNMGYWVDLNDPYITYDNKYIESVWWLLGNLHQKNLLYKGFTIQPYSPAAGTGLSSHELNQPGCYRDVKDRTATVLFKAKSGKETSNFLEKIGLSPKLFGEERSKVHFAAWTTTPWTLPSNTALAVGKNIDYLLIETFLGYASKFNEREDTLPGDRVFVVIAADLYKKYFKSGKKEDEFFDGYSLEANNEIVEDIDGIGYQMYDNQNAVSPNGSYTKFRLIKKFKGSELQGVRYEQLLPFLQPEGDAFRVLVDNGDFVTTTDGTGIVHIAPTFGAEDYKIAKENGVSPLIVNPEPESFEKLINKENKPTYDDFYVLTGATSSFSTVKIKTETGNEVSWSDLGKISWNDLSGYTWSNITAEIKNNNELQQKTKEKYNELSKSLLSKKEYKSLETGEKMPLVDKQGKFLPQIKDGVFLYGNEYVKEAYLNDAEKEAEFKHQKQVLEAAGKIKELKTYLSVDERIVLKLQEEGKLFKKETYEHSYPHCWRTDKPVLYYPLDSWFIKSTAAKQRMIELNKTINWKPEATGTGRFGNWLENLNDWNLSRSRFWGIPIPIWTSEDKTEQLVISSVEQLQKEIANSVAKGFMESNPLAAFKAGDMSAENYNTFDLHKPYADSIVLEQNGKKLFRETDLIDVWFDSGAMPYAQLHYPFENKELVDNKKFFPADFIAEGVDQTRGWFFTLHAIGTMCFDSVAYKNVVSNGLVLDKNGNKMSKRLGNAIDPFDTLPKYGPDATRWYMIANAAPWDNLKFDLEGISEVQRKLFGTLYNTYGFFALYANVDGFVIDESNLSSVAQRAELDRWIISKLNSLIKSVTEAYDEYEPHRAARYIEEFVDEHLSNWYVRLARRRFWRGEMSEDKKAAYETLFECLRVVSQLMSPIAPFFAEWMYKNLTDGIREQAIKNNTQLAAESIHLSMFAKADEKVIDKNLEEQMDLAQRISSMILSIRKKENLRVRQPLLRVQIPVLDNEMQKKITAVQDLIMSEVNIKQIEFVNESQTQIVKNLKLNFKTLGKKCGQHMKTVQAFAKDNGNAIISSIEKTGKYEMNIEGDLIVLETEDVEIIPVDIPGWKVANSGALTVALDINLNEALINEGIARELVNRIQNIRKDKGFEVTDKINIKIQRNNSIETAIKNNLSYICTETLTNNLEVVDVISQAEGINVEVDENISTLITVQKN